MSWGISDLSLCRIREIRGCSGRYGNCSHDNQGISAGDLTASNHDFRRYFTIQDLLVGSSAVDYNRTVADERVFRRFGLGG